MLNIPTTEERLGKSPQRLVRYFVLVMAVVYMGVGAWLLWAASKPDNPILTHLLQIGLTAMRLRFLGLFFILYGLFRFVRSYQATFRSTTPEFDSDPDDDSPRIR